MFTFGQSIRSSWQNCLKLWIDLDVFIFPNFTVRLCADNFVSFRFEYWEQRLH